MPLNSTDQTSALEYSAFDDADLHWMGLRRSTWIKIGVIAALMIWLFYVPCLRRLWQKTNPFWGEPNWGHSFFIPIVGLYYLYHNRDEMLRAPVKPLLGTEFSRLRVMGGALVLATGVLCFFVTPFIISEQYSEYARSGAKGMAALGLLALLLDWGLGFLAWGLLVFAFGIYPGQNDWIKDLGMVMTLFGVVLTLCGWRVMRIAWFPILFLICALPWPGLVYSKIAGPLQQLAASVAVEMLNLFGVAAVQGGTKIHLPPPHQPLNVAEACAGLRSLMTFISVGAAIAFLSNRPLWERIIITLSAIPVAIFCNVMRVSGTGLLDFYVSHELSEGFSHQFVGLVMLLPAMLLILGVGWVLDQLFIEEADDATPGMIRVNRSRPPRPAAPAAGTEGQ